MVHEPSDGTAPGHARLEDGAAVLSKKWTVTVVRVLLESEPLGFSELERRIGAVSGKVLSDCLDRLQEEDIVDRRVVQEEPLRVEYRLTGKGAALEPVVDELATWVGEHVDPETPTLLLADDDRRLVEMHATWLDGDFDVLTATDGTQARDLLDEGVDVLVTDRRMRELSGDDLAQYAEASGLDCGIVFLSSVDVDESLLGVAFDAYVQKPTTPEELGDAIEEVLARCDLPADRRELESVRARQSLFESELPGDVLEQSDRYQELLGRVFDLEQEVTDE